MTPRFARTIALFGAVCALSPAAWARPARGTSTPAPDPAAIRDAMRLSSGGGRYVSARSVAHYLRSLMAEDVGDDELALSELRLSVLYDPTSVHLRFRLAEELALRGHRERAERSIRELLDRHPKHAPSLRLLAELVELRPGTEAVRLLDRAWKADPSDVAAPLALTRYWLERSRLDAALAVVRRLDEEHSGEAGAGARIAGGLVEVSSALARAGRSAEAESLLRRAVERDPSAERLASLASLLEATGRLSEAAEVHARAIGPSGDDPQVIVSAARAFLGAGQGEVATAYLSLLEAREDRSEQVASALVTLGVAFSSASDPASAVRAFAAAVIRTPEDVDLCWLFALALDQTGRRNEAIRRLRAVVATHPRHAASLHRLASWLAVSAAETTLAEAEGYARRALDEQPREPGYLDTLGWILLQRGSVDEALPLLERAAAAVEDPVVQAHLAEARAMAGRVPEARAALERARRLAGREEPDALRRAAQTVESCERSN